MDKYLKRSIREQIASERAELKKLAEIKDYLCREFVATQAEQDIVFGVIEQVCDRRNEHIKELLKKLS